ncbi:IPT/TIG domain-containing protein [Lishizhenia tianjinensis]|uniref:IPT/TIG domain-containing protein n=1 Tax=Lishizhenia tianjinensis TaxID=477690 RepID=A0A1I6ZTB9_9FLAO|nr:IPT/TIG domain-containing protein [Lishizhenia tianjinensis]SFT65929.1 IPT/TIG domain-containing protein [Lishizhenia tianjinensis]
MSYSVFKLLKVLFLVFSIIGYTRYSIAQKGLIPVDLNTKVLNANHIVKGRVIDQTSLWVKNNTNIETHNLVELTTQFKGDCDTNLITIITKGGTIGNEKIIHTANLQLKEGEQGLFFLNNISGSYYHVFSEKQGFYKYEKGVAFDVFNLSSVTDLENDIRSFLGQPTVINLNMTPKSLGQGNNFSFYPNAITAGTNSLITITGSGFGTQGVDSVNYISFEDPEYHVTVYEPLDSVTDYLVWTDTLIKAYVPTKASTGLIRLTLNDVDYFSTDSLYVPYSVVNWNGEIIGLGNQNGSGGMSWSLNSNLDFYANSRLTSARNKWKCATGINWNNNL